MNRSRRPPPIHPAINNPIQQPPHTAGTPLQGLRTKLDPAQIPSTAARLYTDAERWTKESYLTVGDQPVPLSASEYHAIDQGNSTPRFLRPTIYAIPSSSDLQSTTHVPFGIHITPFAQQPPEEAPIPVIDFGESGPPRCAEPECRAYINPWVAWEGGGTRWVCNLCGMTNDAPTQYLSQSRDRLELQRGTIDFLVPKEYWAAVPPKRLIHAFVPVTQDSGSPRVSTSTSNKPPQSLSTALLPQEVKTETRKPQPINYVFTLDTSLEAIQSGFLQSACDILLHLLYGDQPANEGGEEGAKSTDSEGWWPPESRIAILTYDKELVFYDLSPHLDSASQIVIADIDEVFAPLPATSGVFADPTESRHLLRPLLSSLPEQHAQTVRAQPALGSAVAASLALLSQTGGQVICFGTGLPKIGFGSLSEVENERTLYNTDKEPELFKAREEAWKEMAEECVDCGVGVTLVLAPSRAVDVGTIGIVPRLSGGDIYFHPKYNPERDHPILYSQIRRLLMRETAYQATLRLRCTSGIHAKTHYGNALERSSTDLEFGVIDADKSIYVALDYTSALDNLSNLTLDTIAGFISSQTGKATPHAHKQALDTAKQAYFQSAVLYTTSSGERRVRVCNLSLPVVSLAGNVYRYGDYEGVVVAFAKTAMVQMAKKPLREIRDSLTAQCAELLLGYRRYCAAASAASQLILPEGFTLLPVYVNCILKSKPLKGNLVLSDVRTIHAHAISSKTPTELIRYLYPRLYELQGQPETMGTYDETTGRLEMPGLLRSNYTWMQGHGIYLMDDGDVMFLWLGADVEERYWQDLFGVKSAHQLNPAPRRLPELKNSFSIRVREVIRYLEGQTGIMRRFIIVRQNLDALEIDFSNMLMEDTNNDGMSYLDYLCYVHRLISASLDNGYSTITVGNSTARKIPW